MKLQTSDSDVRNHFLNILLLFIFDTDLKMYTEVTNHSYQRKIRKLIVSMNNGIEHIINAKDGLTYIREILGEKYTKVFSKLSITLRDLDIFNTLRYNSHKNVEKRS